MIIECTTCHSKYQYDEDRFERKPAKRIKCAKCGNVFEILNPAFLAQTPAAQQGDSTSHKRDVPRRPPTLEQAIAAEPLPPPKPTGKQAGELQLPVGKRLSLAVIDGPDAGSVFRVEKPRVTLGRSGADMVLNDTDASRQHAAFEARDTLYMLRDLGSTNGTTFEGQKIADAVELQNHSEFLIGSSTVMLIVTDDT